MAVASGFGRGVVWVEAGRGKESATRAERGSSSGGGADRRVCSLRRMLTYALSISYLTATPASLSLSQTCFRVCPDFVAITISGQASRIKASLLAGFSIRPLRNQYIYRRSRRSRITQAQRVPYPIRIPSSRRHSQTRFRECPASSAAKISGHARRISAILQDGLSWLSARSGARSSGAGYSERLPGPAEGALPLGAGTDC